MAVLHVKRQYGSWDDGDDDDDGWWANSNKAIAIKWSVVGAIVILIVLWVFAGYWHFKKRVARGLPPLWYHRCFTARHNRRIYSQQSGQYHNGFADGAIPLHAYPPPAYNANVAAPPAYQPAEGDTKVMPDQRPAERQMPDPFTGASSQTGPSHAAHMSPTYHPDPQPYSSARPPPIRTQRAGLAARLNPFRS